MIPSAQSTGRFTLITDAMAREIVVGKDGKAEAVAYVDKATRTEQRVRAKAIVVAASERVRIGATAAEFTVNDVSGWFGECLRGGRKISNGHGRH